MNVYRAFLARIGWKGTDIQRAFDVGPHSTVRMSREDCTTVERLALSALAAGLEPWSPDNAHEAEALRPVLDAIRKVEEAAHDRAA